MARIHEVKRKVKLFYTIFALFVLLLVILDITGVFRSKETVVSEKDDVEVSGFAVKILGHFYSSGSLVMDYKIFNAADDSKNVEVNYQIISSEGVMVKEGSREVVFDPFSDNEYKLIVPLGDSGAIGKVRISVFNGYLTSSDESAMYSSRVVTGLAVYENVGEISKIAVGLLLIITIVFVWRRLFVYSRNVERVSKAYKQLVSIKV